MERRPCNEEQNFVQQQINEDICKDHGIFCCPECFDVEPIRKDDV